jgi:hypothetical protein
MSRVVWVIVVVVAVLGLLLIVVSANAPVIQQAALGTMVTGLMACLVAIALAFEFGFRKRS